MDVKVSSPLRWRTRFLAVGRGPFPVDMLRYDSSFPEGELDSIVIEQTISNPYPERQEGRTGSAYVSLVHYSSFPGWRPSVDRWRSFGWEAAIDPGVQS